MINKILDSYKESLLDLSKRNNSLNFRDVRLSTLEILFDDIEELFILITQNDNDISVYKEKNKLKMDTLYITTEMEFNNKFTKSEYFQISKDKLNDSEIICWTNSSTLIDTIFKNILKRGKEFYSEKGANVVYIAFGFLNYNESDNSSRYYKAPILLKQVSLDYQNGRMVIKNSGEDVFVNYTLIKYLKKNYGININMYDNNMSIKKYFDYVKELIEEYDWNVIEEVKIGIFSFSKLMMYQDIEENEDILLNNENIKIILDIEHVNDNDYNIFFDDIEKKENLFSKQTNVLDADFSQCKAIELACSGKSFVLQGPPGTGKSQTISNIIAELLTYNKKILFVSEKMAALDVVYNNMKKVGLDTFCLQLHNYNSNKKAFYNDLEESYTMKSNVSFINTNKFNETIYDDVVKKISNYSDELFDKNNAIKTPIYDILSILSKYNNKNYKYSLDTLFIDMDVDAYNKNLDLISEYICYIDDISNYYFDFPLYGLDIKENSINIKSIVKDEIIFLMQCFSKLKEYSEHLKKYGISIKSFNDIQKFLTVTEIVKNCNDTVISDNFLHISNDDYIVILKKLLEKISELETFEFQAYERYNEIDNNLINQILGYKSSLKRLFSKKYRRHINSLKRIIIYDSFKPNDIFKILPLITHYNELLSEIKFLSSKLGIKLSNKITKATLVNYIGLIENFYYYSDDNITFKTLLTMDNEQINNICKEINNIYDVQDYHPLKSKLQECQQYFDINVVNLMEDDIVFVLDKINIFHSNIELLNIWISFSNLKDRVEKSNLDKFLKLCKEEFISTKEFTMYFEYLFYSTHIGIILKNKNLNNYFRNEHDRDINKFVEYDILKFIHSQDNIRKFLLHNYRNIDTNEYRLIQKENKKKRMQKPIRGFIHDNFNSISIIKPVFLMSPLSVSTYLPSNINFDVVIFDEASQISPEDSIVAIYRAKQLIIVGDDKQMPPSNFFNVVDEYDDGDYDDVPKLYESILDVSLTKYRKEMLLYHYRSKNEALIAFSNKNFYDNKLITFPDTNINNTGIKYVYVNNAIYNSSRRDNIIEAEKIVEIIIEHIEKFPNRSLGVVTFNVQQQNLIQSLVEEKILSIEKYFSFFDENKKEHFFIKNLENVQGDERDTIILGITYSKNEYGQFFNRFGPLNNEGGERRLNVAITRAKYELIVVTSIKSQDIDYTKSKNIGPKLLHDYLEYAELGISSLKMQKVLSENIKFDSDFEQEVYKYLVDKGFEVFTQVGCSNFKIDLCLKKPNSSKFVLAIECDGYTYHSSKSARDRDRIRQNILENLGWKFYRIWSTDWFYNNEKEKKLLLEACNRALNDTI